MIRKLTIGLTATFLSAIPAMSQQPGQQPVAHTDTVPLYSVTVVQRQVDAVNYQYRSGPTKVNFRGTVLLTGASGEATVESQRGRTEITAKFDRVPASSRFGKEYLTYVLWAISPEGAPHNLGEIIPNGSDHATLHVTTDLQAFGLIATAEPYSAVREPSDVVVLENEVRADTIGKIQPIRAKYELLPRGHYTWHVPQNAAADAAAPKVSMRTYEAISQVYQAQNALEIARAANAAQLAPTTFSEAERMLAEARRLQSVKADSSLIVQSARAAAQTAEDARVIAQKRGYEQNLAAARSTAASAEQATLQAQAEAQRAKAELNAARALIDTERAAREQAEAATAQASAVSQPPVVAASRAEAQRGADRMAVPPAPAPPERADATQKNQLRMRLLEGLNGIVATRDTPRGLVVTLPDQGFSGSALRAAYAEHVARIAALLSTEPDLRVEVEGNSDSPSLESFSTSRANEVRIALTRAGLASSSVQAHGLGASRLLTSNATESGRIANRRVEIIISGSPIGDAPIWNRSYSLTGR